MKKFQSALALAFLLAGSLAAISCADHNDRRTVNTTPNVSYGPAPQTYVPAQQPVYVDHGHHDGVSAGDVASLMLLHHALNGNNNNTHTVEHRTVIVREKPTYRISRPSGTTGTRLALPPAPMKSTTRFTTNDSGNVVSSKGFGSFSNNRPASRSWSSSSSSNSFSSSPSASTSSRSSWSFSRPSSSSSFGSSSSTRSSSSFSSSRSSFGGRR